MWSNDHYCINPYNVVFGQYTNNHIPTDNQVNYICDVLVQNYNRIKLSLWSEHNEHLYGCQQKIINIVNITLICGTIFGIILFFFVIIKVWKYYSAI